MTAPIYSLKSVKRLYAGRVALEIDSLVIEQNEIVGLSGPNGGGKTTLLRTLAFLDAPEQGDILFCGKSAWDDIQKARQETTLLNQEPFLLKRAVKTNVAYGLKIRKQTGIEDKVREALDMVGLDYAKFANRQWYELSGGERQRVALAARLAIKPKVLLLDEPTASLDRESAGLVQKAAMAASASWNATLVVASHDFKWLHEVSSRILSIAEGKIGPNEDYFGAA